MIRAVLVGWSVTDWKIYRQSQRMAEVRRTPEASSPPRRHLDIEESAFSVALEAWKRDESGSSLEAALDLLGRFGAQAVVVVLWLVLAYQVIQARFSH